MTKIDTEAAAAIIQFAAEHSETISPEPRNAPLKAENNKDSDPSRSGSETVAQEDEIATEAGHWYLPDGSPFYTVPRKTGPQKGQPRPVSLRWDRKLLTRKGAGPSVTTVSKIIEKPALNHYFKRQIFEAMIRWLHTSDMVALEHALIKGTLDTDALFKEINAASQEHRDIAAARGTGLHTAIEQFLRGDLLTDKRWLPHIANIARATCQYGINVREGAASEKSFFHPMGFGGKVDLHYRGDDGLIIDFKSKPEIELGKKLAYDEHAMQIAAYREGLNIPHASGINIFVGEQDREVFIHEWNQSDLNRGWKLFRLIFRFWQIKNNYYNRQPNNND